MKKIKAALYVVCLELPEINDDNAEDEGDGGGDDAAADNGADTVEYKFPRTPGHRGKDRIKKKSNFNQVLMVFSLPIYK